MPLDSDIDVCNLSEFICEVNSTEVRDEEVLGERYYLSLIHISGESFYFKAGQKHFIENKSSKDAMLIWVSTPPSF